jgi:hypothetical protein
MELIQRYEVMKAIDSGEPFDLTFITADRRRGTGGKPKEVKGWAKLSAADEERLPGQYRASKAVLLRDPGHFQHRTINIYNPNNPAEHPQKVHWRLMVFFNGKRIIQ